jgi:hypothetical protein
MQRARTRKMGQSIWRPPFGEKIGHFRKSKIAASLMQKGVRRIMQETHDVDFAFEANAFGGFE